MQRAFLALGSNLGDRQAQLRQAVQWLAETPGIQLVKASGLYETEPQQMAPTEQAGLFLNAAVEIETTLSAQGLLAVCLQIEQRLGRVRSAVSKVNGYHSRTLDLDILFYGKQCLKEDVLQVPHPRLHERAFVLAPLNEIAPHWRHPVLSQTVGQLYRQISASQADGVVRRIESLAIPSGILG